jgi:hypothetical protein
MRARLMMKLMGIVFLLVITIVSAHSCSNSSPKSDLNPTNLARNGIAGVCADQQAADEANGDDGQTPATAVSQSQLSGLQQSNPGGVQALEQALGGNLSCPTTTVDAGGG